MTDDDAVRRRRQFVTVSRDEARVTPLELFFDLVFVLAITQSTAMMAARPTWAGIGQGLLVLTSLWWAWVGYAWLTSTVNPEEGSVRLVIIAAMAGLLVAAMAGPGAFDGDGLLFAVALASVRVAHIALYLLASRGEAKLREAVLWLGASTALGVSLLVVASFADGWTRNALWIVAIACDVGGPLFRGVDGWRLEPAHFAERHGLVVLIALGESIVVLGAGTDRELDAAVLAVIVLGITLLGAMWWAYFDVVAIVAERRLTGLGPGSQQNAMARDSYSYLHLPMVAGIVLVAFGLKKVLKHPDEPLALEPAAALSGGVALYLLAHVAFRLRNIRTVNRQRLVVGLVLLAAIPIAHVIDAVGALAMTATAMVALIAYETTRYAEARDKIRHLEA